MTKKLYVTNLAFNAKAPELQALFAADGRKVASVQVPIDKISGRARGFAFVEMVTFEDAQGAIKALNGAQFMGRPITVTESRDKPDGGRGAGGREGGGRDFDRPRDRKSGR